MRRRSRHAVYVIAAGCVLACFAVAVTLTMRDRRVEELIALAREAAADGRIDINFDHMVDYLGRVRAHEAFVELDRAYDTFAYDGKSRIAIVFKDRLRAPNGQSDAAKLVRWDTNRNTVTAVYKLGPPNVDLVTLRFDGNKVLLRGSVDSGGSATRFRASLVWPVTGSGVPKEEFR